MDGVSGSNGVYAYSASSTFPNQSWNSSNYWVDVTFATDIGPDTTPPMVTAQSPTSGATGIATNTTITATFSEALDMATITESSFELRGPAPDNVLVPATVNYDPSTLTATLIPSAALAVSTAYTATVKGDTTGPSVKDSAGNALATDSTWTFTTAGSVVSGCSGSTNSIWPANPAPFLITEQDSSAVELGVKFRSNEDGLICGIRFYKGSSNIGTHVGNLWSNTGALLATATFSGETASGWQQVSFSTPVPITANTVYVASYHTNVGFYSADVNYFATTGVDSSPLYALADGETGGNGVYAYSASSTFPSQTWNSSNYWVDVVFTTP
jgi:hypothetical protein